MGVAGDIDEQIAEQPVDQPGQGWRGRRTRYRHLGKRDFKLIELIVPGLVDARRLRRRADEEAGEQIGKRRVALPVQDDALQKIRTTQERAVIGIGAAHDHMVAAAGTGVAPVDHELVGAKPAPPRLFVDRRGDVDAILPAGSRMDVDLDHARIRRNADDVDALVLRRRIALDVHGQSDRGCSAFRGRDEVEIFLDAGHRRHEDAEPAVARLDADGGAHQPGYFVAWLCLRAFRYFRGLKAGMLRAGAAFGEIRQIVPGNGRVDRMDIGIGGGRDIGQGAERQAITDGAVAGNEEDAAAARLPFLAHPPHASGTRIPGLHRQHVAGRCRQAAFEDAGHAAALFGVLQLGIGGIDVLGEVCLLQQPVGGIFEGRLDHLGRHAQFACHQMQQTFGVLRGDVVVACLLGDEVGAAPDRHAVLAPVEREGPARQAFAGIPLALAIVQETAGREAFAQAADQRVRLLALGWADRVSVPLLGLEVVDRNEGRLAAHRQPYVVFLEHAIDLFTERVQGFPAFVGERLGDARMFRDTCHLHVEGEIGSGVGIAEEAAGDRRGVAIMGRCGKRNVAFAGQEARGGVEPDPAGAGQVDLGPGMQVGKVVVGARGAVERLEIGRELDEIARDETGGEAEIAQDLDQQPARIATGTAGRRQGVLRRLDPGLHADDVADLLLQARIEPDHHIDRALPRAVDCREESAKRRPDRFRRHIDLKIIAEICRIGEGPVFRLFFDEKVERIVDGHVGDEIDLDLQLADRIGKDEAGKVVAVGILLQVDEMIGGRNLQRVADDLRLGMSRRLQPDDLRRQPYGTVIGVVGQVIDTGLDRHAEFDPLRGRSCAPISGKFVQCKVRKQARKWLRKIKALQRFRTPVQACERLAPLRLDERGVDAGKPFLAVIGEVGIGRRRLARFIEPGDLFRRQRPADGTKVLAELLLVAGADDDARNGRAPQEPVDGDLRNRLAGLLGQLAEHVDDIVELAVVDGRAVSGRIVQAASFRPGLAAADLAGEAAPAERAPDQRADALVGAERHQFPFVVAADERIVDLVGDMAHEAVLLRDGQRFHQLPAGEVGGADVA
ncbi:hypothetical protein D9M68_430580 [compost metagenome]